MTGATGPADPAEVLARLREMQADDLDVHDGRALAYVYAAGLADVDRLGREAVAAYAGSNGLDPTAFPSVQRMENELVGTALDLLDAPDDAVGTVTSGGTESVLLAVQAARDSRRDVLRPRMVLPDTAHGAFHKAAHYFGVETAVVPVGADFRADAEAMTAAIDADTVLVVASAPSYAHGVVDPVTEIARAAGSRGVRCHVDACIGGWVLPYAARLGRDVPAWTFAVPGVTSISVDLHKYAYAPKGASLLLHRTAAHRRPQLFAWADWPGYTLVNATMQSTRSGGPVAGAWAVVQAIGDEGYLRLAEHALATVDRVVEAVAGIDGLHVVAAPDSTLVALGTDARCDPFTISDEMAARGWLVQPQLTYAAQPATLHLSVSAATHEHVEELVAALAESTAAAVAAGPVAVDPEVAAYVRALDPALLSDAEVDGLLEAAGLGGGGGLALPERMAEVNALLDLAAPALREALMAAFLDRLARPIRSAGGGSPAHPIG